MKKNSSIFLMFVFLTQALFSQFQQSWINRYNYSGNSNEVGDGMVIDPSGSVYVTGYTESSSGSYFTTVKYSSAGQQLWSAQYGSPEYSSSYNHSIIIDSSNYLYISGESNNKITTVKYDQNGVQQWVKSYTESGSASMGHPIKIAIDKHGFIYVIGYFGENNEMIIIKYSQAGEVIWSEKFKSNGSEGDVAYSIAFDRKDNIYIGCKAFISVNISQFNLLKYKSSGVFQWARSRPCGGPPSGVPKVTCSPDGSILLVGGRDMGINNKDIFAAKYSEHGEMVWEVTINGTSNSDDDANSILTDSLSNIYLLGSIENAVSGMDVFLAKYSPNGNMIWSYVYNSTSNGMDFGRRLIMDNSSNLYICGSSDQSSGSGYDYLILMFDNNGILKWSDRYNGTGNNTDVANAILLDNNNNLLVSGWSSGVSTGTDIATIKYSQTIGIIPVSTEIPNSYSLSQNYPNPFNPVTKIRFDIPLLRGVFTKLSVFDMLGREVTTLVNEHLKPGTYEVDWNASAYPSGVYFYRLQAGTFNQTLKMVLIK